MRDLDRGARARPAASARLPILLIVVLLLVGAYAAAHPPSTALRSALMLPRHLHLSFPWREARRVTNARSALAACALLAAAAAAALRIMRQHDWLAGERPLVFGLWAVAFTVVPAATVGAIGSVTGAPLLRPPIGFLLAALPAFAYVLIDTGKPSRAVQAGIRAPAAITLVVAAAAAAVLLASTIVSLTHAPNGYEALMYHAPLASIVWKDGNLTSFLDASPDNVMLANPLAMELWNGIFLYIGGERLADLAQLPFAALGAASVYAFARRLGLLRRAAQLAAASFLLVPMVVAQSGMQHNDLSGAAVLMAAFALAAAPSPWTPARLASIAAGVGLAVTTKLALLPPAVAVALFALMVVVRDGASVAGTTRVRGLAIAALAFAVVVAPWWSRNLLRYHNPLFPADLPVIGLGRSEAEMPPKDHEFVTSRPAWLLYPLRERHSDRSGFGVLFASFALPGVFVAMRRARSGVRRARSRPVVLFLLNIAVTVPAWWFMTRHEPRFLIASLALALAFVPYTLLALGRSERRLATAVLGAAAVFSAMITASEGLLPLAEQPRERVAYFSQVWGVDPAAMMLPENEPILLHTSFAPTTYPAYYPLMGRSLQRRVLTMDGEFPTAEIIRRMRAAGARLAYVAVAPDAESQAAVAKMYDHRHFDVAHVSIEKEGKRTGTRRYLFKLR